MLAAYINRSGMQGIEVAFDAGTRAALEEAYDFLPDCLTGAPETECPAEILFSTWGMPALTAEELTRFPRLQAVYYAAGSVQSFARPFMEKGIRVHSAFAANAEPVAEYAAAQILLAGKGFFTACRLCSDDPAARAAAQRHSAAHPGNYGIRVGILGAGAIGTRVIRRLKAGDVDILVFDPFLPDEKAAELGVTKTSLEEVFARCQTVSCHLANNEQTKGMLTYAHFSRMLPTATFINTGRGAQVVEADLMRALEEEPERTAVLDVTFPEPPEAEHPFYRLPNVFLTPHIAGSMGQECWRMGRYMLEDAARVDRGEAPLWEVTPEMLKTMA